MSAYAVLGAKDLNKQLQQLSDMVSDGVAANKQFFKGSNKLLTNIVDSLNEVVGIMHGEADVRNNLEQFTEEVTDVEVVKVAIQSLTRAKVAPTDETLVFLKEREEVLKTQKPLYNGLM